MIKPQTVNIGRKVVHITSDGGGRIGTLMAINRRGVFVRYDGSKNLELVNRKFLHWGPGGDGKRKNAVPQPNSNDKDFECKNCRKTVRKRSVTEALQELKLCPQCYTTGERKDIGTSGQEK